MHILHFGNRSRRIIWDYICHDFCCFIIRTNSHNNFAAAVDLTRVGEVANRNWAVGNFPWVRIACLTDSAMLSQWVTPIELLWFSHATLARHTDGRPCEQRTQNNEKDDRTTISATQPDDVLPQMLTGDVANHTVVFLTIVHQGSNNVVDIL